MDITLARTFVAIAEWGSFIEAAHRLHVTQSTVSARVRTLENELGRVLFERSKSGAKLTPAGEQFYRHALALIRVWQHAQLEVGIADQHEDHLTIGAQMSLWDEFLLRLLADLRKFRDDLAMTATVGKASELIQRIGEGTVDIGVMYRPLQPPGIVIEHLFDDELVLVTSNKAKRRTRRENYVLVNWGPEFEADHAEAFPELAFTSLRLDLGAIGLRYLLDNKASGYFPIRIVKPHLVDGSLTLVDSARRFFYPVYAAYPEERDEATYDPILKRMRKFAK